MPLNFASTTEEYALIRQIAYRAEGFFRELDLEFNRSGLMMDLDVVHSNGCPMDFPTLLGFPDRDFIHDIAGIRQHLDRTTGELGENFVPRCAKQGAAVGDA